MRVEPIDRMDKTHCTAAEHRSRLSLLLQGTEGLETSLAGEALPASLLEINRLLRSGQHEEAKARFDQAALQGLDDYLRANPTRTDTMYVAAKLLAEIDQYAPAERFLKMILDEETHPEVLVELVHLIRKDPARTSDAIVYARQAYEMDPDKLEYLHAYLRCVRDIGDVKECIKLLEHAVTLAPQHCGLEFQLLWNMNYLPGYDRAYLF